MKKWRTVCGAAFASHRRDVAIEKTESEYYKFKYWLKRVWEPMQDRDTFGQELNVVLYTTVSSLTLSTLLTSKEFIKLNVKYSLNGWVLSQTMIDNFLFIFVFRFKKKKQLQLQHKLTSSPSFFSPPPPPPHLIIIILKHSWWSVPGNPSGIWPFVYLMFNGLSQRSQNGTPLVDGG